MEADTSLEAEPLSTLLTEPVSVPRKLGARSASASTAGDGDCRGSSGTGASRGVVTATPALLSGCVQRPAMASGDAGVSTGGVDIDTAAALPRRGHAGMSCITRANEPATAP